MAVKLGNGNWAVKEDKLLAYNDNSGRFFNKEFDFSRGSSATYVAKDGLIKTAGLQETNLVNNGDFSELGSELVTNGNFDTDSDWTKGTGWSISGGKASCDGTQTTFSNLQQNNVTEEGKIYKVTLDIESISGTIELKGNGVYNRISDLGVGTHTFYITADRTYFRFLAFSSATATIDNVSFKQVDPNDYWTLGTGWSIGDNKAVYSDGAKFSQFKQQLNNNNTSIYQLSFDAIVNAGQFRIKFGSNNYDIISQSSSYKVYGVFNANNTFITFEDYDDITSDFSISNISVKEVQADTPRIDFSDSVKGALLLEPQSTNLFPYSENFSEWSSLSNAVVTDNFTTSPDGTQNASKFTFDGTLTGRVEKEIAVTNGNEYTFSIWLKNDNLSDPTQVWLAFSTFGQGQYITVTNEWQRFTTTQTANGSNEYPRIQTNEIGSIFAWGAMVEEKSFATSYIPNHGVSGGVTRLADVCNNSGSAQDFNSEEGVLYAEIANLSSSGGDGYLSLSSDDGTQNNRATIRFTATTNNLACQYVIGAVNQTSMDNILTDRTEFNKIAFLYSLNNFVVFVNGVKLSTDTSGSVLPKGTFKKLTFNNGIAAPMYAKIRNVQVFTEAKSDAFLQALTTI